MLFLCPCAIPVLGYVLIQRMDDLFSHSRDSMIIMGGFFAAGIAAFLLLMDFILRATGKRNAFLFELLTDTRCRSI